MTLNLSNPAASIRAEDWYEVVPFADGVFLIHEPWIHPFFRCNMWFVRGAERDLLVDTGLGHFSLRAHVPLLCGRPIVCVSSHAHFDHVGSTHEFDARLAHPAEAEIFADPRPEWTLAASYANEDMFIAPPEDWESAAYRVKPCPATGFVEDGDVVDLGDRRFEVIHTPGHSPGGIALFERATGTLIAGDIVYDGDLIDDTFHSDRAAYRASLARVADLPVRIVHGGHFQSFGPTRLKQLVVAYTG
ncbi:MBL fold metallo-hydrolase [Pararhizobium sp. YC-54]|uniref:MBL fold metallo-hydrolase n=1 Tax=Pararhizobium sp. YC-54 TaxID=2986920 RepID=UPI0021F7763B|nr:MBL fold metallo-hydrolase [Pararhizobium sp. YC-54]MCW0001062.1 MBL fold metallo-hydrolase [Pararhizobium sp. YC-54]